ncbi:MAG: hypothetical protein CMO19_00325 [Thaumarchaeota archaeon]|nr:hypothetical protein [Nitrososphaerota archaeon]|tara:strand:- start:7414 stop:8202 length:789 start_codon:yes stop_codon:yes gene_type:complete
MQKNIIVSYGEARFFSTKIIPFVISAILLFLLLQIVQSAGLSESQIGAEEEQFGNNDVPSGFGDENLYTLEVNLILREEIEPYLQPINGQLVEVFWDMRDIETQEMKEFTLTSNTDTEGKAIFDLFPGQYKLRINYNGIARNETIIIIPNTENNIDWVISKYSIGEYNLEFRDRNGGIIYPEETIRMIYRGAPQLIDPSSIQLSSELGDINIIFNVKEVINRAEISIMELSPEESFVVGNFSPDNPPKALIYSIDIDKRAGL